MKKDLTVADLKEGPSFEALDAARVWDLKHHGWRVHARGGSQHVVGDTTYWWHGEERGGDPDHPFVIVQLTLAGWGFFERGGERHRIGAGDGFIAVVPSDHLYYLPESSPDWRFIWLDIMHPYAVERLAALAARHGPCLSLGRDSAILQRMTALLERLAYNHYPDDYALEEDVLGFVIALERQVMQERYPADARGALLKEVRDLVLARLSSPPSVAELATHYGQSRVRFTQRFKGTTDIAPGAFIDTVRLSSAASLLESTSDKIESIALATGYHSATQLSKAFKKTFKYTPGAYRAYFGRAKG